MIENSQTILPIFESIQTNVAEVAWVAHDLSVEPIEVPGKRILLVEDEQPLRSCLRMMLELEGHQVSEASNGAEALKIFNPDEFDLVITDYEMPVMQGNQLAIRIKRLAPSLPILMVTGSGQARRDATNPVDLVMSKPFTMTDLRLVVGELLPPGRRMGLEDEG